MYSFLVGFNDWGDETDNQVYGGHGSGSDMAACKRLISLIKCYIYLKFMVREGSVCQLG